MEETDNKLAIAGAISNMRTFASTYISRKRHVEMYKGGGILREHEVKLARAKAKLDEAQNEYTELKIKFDRLATDIPLTEQWLVDNEEKFKSFECMLSDKVTDLAQKLKKLVG